MTYSATNQLQERAEQQIWQALGLDDLDNEMQTTGPGSTAVVMGTGRTDNACQMCSNSLTTSGCGGC